MIIAYLIVAAWFCAVDMVAGRIAGSPFRPIGAVLLALFWPVTVPFALLACAALLRPRLRGTPEKSA